MAFYAQPALKIDQAVETSFCMGDWKGKGDTFVQLFCSLAGGLIATVRDTR
jgi:hypothetical protein